MSENDRRLGAILSVQILTAVNPVRFLGHVNPANILALFSGRAIRLRTQREYMTLWHGDAFRVTIPW